MPFQQVWQLDPLGRVTEQYVLRTTRQTEPTAGRGSRLDAVNPILPINPKKCPSPLALLIRGTAYSISNKLGSNSEWWWLVKMLCLNLWLFTDCCRYSPVWWHFFFFRGAMPSTSMIFGLLEGVSTCSIYCTYFEWNQSLEARHYRCWDCGSARGFFMFP